MTRFQRKNRTDIKFMGRGGLTDAFDDAVKFLWRVNDDELNYLCTLDNKILDAIMPNENEPITKLKEYITIINNALEQYNGNKNKNI